MSRSNKGIAQNRDKLLIEIGIIYEFFNYNLDGVIEKFVEILEKLIEFDAHIILYFNEETGRFELTSEKNTDLKIEELKDLSSDDLQVLDKDNIPVHLIEKLDDKNANPVFKKGGKVKSFITMPLITRNKIIGFIFIGSFKESDFDNDDKELVYTFSSQVAVAIDNIKLYEKSIRSLEILKKIYEIEKKITRNIELEKLIAICLEEIQSICSYDSSAFLFFSEDNQNLIVRESRGVELHKSEIYRLAVSSLNKETRDTLFIEKNYIVSGNTNRDTHLKLFAFSDKIKSVLIIPITYENNLLSILVLNSNNIHYFTEEAVQKLKLLAEHIAIAIQNSLFYEDIKLKIREVEDSNKMIKEYSEKLKEINLNLERNIESLTTLFEIGKIINSSPSLEETLALILSKTVGLVNADNGSIMLVDEENGVLRLMAKFGKREKEMTKDLVLRIGEGIAGWVAKTGRARITEDVSKDPMYYKQNILENLNFSMISLPLKVNDKIIGVLNIEKNKRSGSFNRDDLNILGSLADHAAIAVEKSKNIQDSIKLFDQTVGALAAAIDAKDSYTFGHTERVRILAEMIAKKLNLSEREIKAIGRAALLHDIGKIGIPEKILLKPGKLVDKEMEQIKEHSILGAGILEPIKQIRYEAELILHHHEHFDGKGYPDGLKQDEIPIGSRIILVADTYDSITTDRPYRTAQPEEYAISEIKHYSGSQFDPLVVGAFLSIIDEYREIIQERGLSKSG
ncbi:MAG: GAF domain-containing protein [Candidatus Hydrogenedentota bacterium]